MKKSQHQPTKDEIAERQGIEATARAEKWASSTTNEAYGK